MGNIKKFAVFNGNEVPPKSQDEFMLSHNSSDYYLAKVEYMYNRIKPALIRYCFDRKKWLNAQSGTFRVIEYYKEM